MENVKDLIKDIHDNLKQASASSKDEVKVMKAMLNDKDFTVDIYGKDGKVGEYNPSSEVRSAIGGIIASTTKITKTEAEGMIGNYEFKNSEAEAFVNLSKEYVNTYLDTGRKLSLGSRKESDISLLRKEEKEGYVSYPKKIGEKDGVAIYDKGKTFVPAHKGIKVISPCPEHLRSDK
jgi:hypothetical protein